MDLGEDGFLFEFGEEGLGVANVLNGVRDGEMGRGERCTFRAFSRSNSLDRRRASRSASARRMVCWSRLRRRFRSVKGFPWFVIGLETATPWINRAILLVY